MSSTKFKLQQDEKWFSSSATKKLLGISDCHLMHKRLSGEIIFYKEGNKFYYYLEQEVKEDDR
jgi:hypothetical protein